jgi:hypothetical protein
MIVAQKRGTSAALGFGPRTIFSFFSSGLARHQRQTGRKKRGWVGWRFTQGGGLGGLALGYCHSAPPGHRGSEPVAAANAGRPSRRKPKVVGLASLNL